MVSRFFGTKPPAIFTKAGWIWFFNRDRSLRIGVFFIVLAILFWGKNNLSDEAHDDVNGAIIDHGFELTKPINELMVQSKAWLMFFEISSSWCIDLIFLGMFLPWIYKGESLRLILAYALFYGIRSIVQTICVMPYPTGMIWIFPVVPSITVPFGVTSDFFPSGHVGFCTIAAAEFAKRRWWGPMVVAWLVGVYEVIIMLSARGHYSIDLITGALMAHYFHGWAHSLCTGWGRCCIDRIVGPYLLHDWALNPLNKKAYHLPTSGRPDHSSPRSEAGGGLQLAPMPGDASPVLGGFKTPSAGNGTPQPPIDEVV